MNSFRLRLALLTGAVAGVLLFAAGFYAWRLTVRFNLDRLDRELRNLGAANLERVVGDEHWRRVESALRFVSGADRPPAYALWVENYGRELYRSPHWPRQIEPASLPEPATYEGGLSFSSLPRAPRAGEPLSPRNPPLPRKAAHFASVRSEGSDWRVAILGSPYTRLVVAANIDEFNRELLHLRYAFLAAIPIALFLVSGAAWFLSGRALRPVRTLTAAAERVTARGLDQRIPASGIDREFHQLVTVFNEMMNRLEKSFHQATRFSGDASHELKTPLALLQAELEQALANTAPGSPQQQTYTSLLDEVIHLKAIVQKLLLLSLADSGRLELSRERTDLSQLLLNVVQDCVEIAPALQIERIVPPNVIVQGDAVLLEQALQNLASNAIKYNRADGRISFELKCDSSTATIVVGNSGPGIAAQDRPRVFERFFRGDSARTREAVAGSGLGLSLSREIIRAHGGELALGAARDDWTTFVATLPLAKLETKSAKPPLMAAE